jgi:Stage II sporulation protein
MSSQSPSAQFTALKQAILAILLCLPAAAQTINIGVFTLFRPVELRVTPATHPLLVTTAGTTSTLEGHQFFTIRFSQFTGPIRITARDGAATDFHLAIPGKIDRQFHGILTIQAASHNLEAIVTMDREIAVASVVAAEMIPTAPLEALKAQAVSARSYYAATVRRHDDYDFCDTTHCQFLRARPHEGSPAFRAAQETRGQLLEYDSKPLAAFYSASCGGQTRALDNVTAGYPYYSVTCDYCRLHSPGQVRGHQLGLCQSGAAGMAAAGATFQAILDHYFPGASLTQNPLNAIFLLPLSPPLRHSKD